MVFWRSKSFIDDDTAAWHFENFAWLIEEFGTEGMFHRTELVLPTRGTFTVSATGGHELALELFQKVKAFCNMEDFPILLAADGAPRTEASGPGFGTVSEKRALGRFVADNDGVMITYAADLLEKPQDLIATFVHELSHYLIGTRETPLPCSDDEEEFLTDLCAVFLGFGVFLANTRFSHTVSSVGWGQSIGWQRTGYLPERDIIFATAIFLAAKDLEPEAANQFLKPHLRRDLEKAFASLSGSDTIAELKRIADRSLAE